MDAEKVVVINGVKVYKTFKRVCWLRGMKSQLPEDVTHVIRIVDREYQHGWYFLSPERGHVIFTSAFARFGDALKHLEADMFLKGLGVPVVYFSTYKHR